MLPVLGAGTSMQISIRRQFMRGGHPGIHCPSPCCFKASATQIYTAGEHARDLLGGYDQHQDQQPPCLDGIVQSVS